MQHHMVSAMSYLTMNNSLLPSNEPAWPYIESIFVREDPVTHSLNLRAHAWQWEEDQIRLHIRIGKIVHAVLGKTSCITTEKLQYPLSQILQARWPVIIDAIVCRHANPPYKIVSIVLCSPYSAYSYNY